MLPAYNLIKAALLSCRLQRIPQKLQASLCPCNTYQSREALQGSASSTGNKGHANPAAENLHLTGIDGKALTVARGVGISPGSFPQAEAAAEE